MSDMKSIWHTTDEKPINGFGMVVYYSKKYNEKLLVGYYNTEYEDFRPLDEFYCEEKTIKKWCYLDDLIALLTELEHTGKTLEQSEICCTEWEKEALDHKAENIALSGDLECAHKALDVAVDALKTYSSKVGNWLYGEFQGDYDKDPGETADKALEQITVLEQKD